MQELLWMDYWWMFLPLGMEPAPLRLLQLAYFAAHLLSLLWRKQFSSIGGANDLQTVHNTYILFSFDALYSYKG